MAADIVVKKTHEIDESLWQKIVSGFNESFGLNVNIDGLKTGWYISNPWGYAYHAMAMDENDELMAYNVFTPARYDNGLNVVVSGSTFVRPKYRKNVMLFAQLIKALRKRCTEDGFDLEVGVPNHNSIKYHCKINKVTMVGDLSYYILPINVSKTLGKSMPAIVDGCWKCLCQFHLFVNRVLSRLINPHERERKFSISTDDTFYSTRFANKEYKIVSDNRFKFVYRLCEEDGKQVAYLMDFREAGKKSYRALTHAIHYLVKSVPADAILYVGFMNFKQVLMLKAPKQMAPKRLPLTCYVLNKDNKLLQGDVSNLDNWNFSLMSFDVR